MIKNLQIFDEYAQSFDQQINDNNRDKHQPATVDDNNIDNNKLKVRHVVLVTVKLSKSILGFILEAKVVSSKHLTQVHLKILSHTLENLASHLMTKYIFLKHLCSKSSQTYHKCIVRQ